MFKQIAIGIVSIIATLSLLVLMAILDEPTPKPLPPPTLKQNQMAGGCVHQQSGNQWIKTCG